MVKVKICGITNMNDANMAVDSGADALGFIFASSPRSTSPETARDIIQALPPFVKSVGVFVDEDPAVIEELIDTCGLDLVQLHGSESPEVCEKFMPRTIKALRIRDDFNPQTLTIYKGKIKALLLDTYSEKMAGGTGLNFDWDLALRAKRVGIPIILAGGLDPSNIERAVSTVMPYAVDVNSGIEESPGIKSPDLVKELFERIRRTRR